MSWVGFLSEVLVAPVNIDYLFAEYCLGIGFHFLISVICDAVVQLVDMDTYTDYLNSIMGLEAESSLGKHFSSATGLLQRVFGGGSSLMLLLSSGSWSFLTVRPP